MLAAFALGRQPPHRLGEHFCDQYRPGAALHRDRVSELELSTGGFHRISRQFLDFDLPLLDEPLPPSRGRYSHEHTKAWSDAVAAVDGYIFITGEYNLPFPGR